MSTLGSSTNNNRMSVMSIEDPSTLTSFRKLCVFGELCFQLATLVLQLTSFASDHWLTSDTVNFGVFRVYNSSVDSSTAVDQDVLGSWFYAFQVLLTIGISLRIVLLAFALTFVILYWKNAQSNREHNPKLKETVVVRPAGTTAKGSSGDLLYRGGIKIAIAGAILESLAFAIWLTAVGLFTANDSNAFTILFDDGWSIYLAWASLGFFWMCLLFWFGMFTQGTMNNWYQVSNMSQFLMLILMETALFAVRVAKTKCETDNEILHHTNTAFIAITYILCWGVVLSAGVLIYPRRLCGERGCDVNVNLGCWVAFWFAVAAACSSAVDLGVGLAGNCRTGPLDALVITFLVFPLLLCLEIFRAPFREEVKDK